MIGGVLRLLRLWPLTEPLRNFTGPPPEQDYREAVNVGECGACLGTVLYSSRARVASCPCGATVLLRRQLDRELGPR